eukprot:73785_1
MQIEPHKNNQGGVFHEFLNKDLTLEEKKKLRLDLLSLPPEKLGEIIYVLRNIQPQKIKQLENEMEVDLRQLNTRTLRHLQRYVNATFANIRQRTMIPTMFMPMQRPMNMNNTFHNNVNTNIQTGKNVNWRTTKTEILKQNETEIGLDDKKEMMDICVKLGIEHGMDISTYVYGYEKHLDVYKDLLKWVQMDENERNKNVNELSSNQLRDIKMKIRSEGTTGRKNEMAKGVCESLKCLKMNYEKYVAENSNENK